MKTLPLRNDKLARAEINARRLLNLRKMNARRYHRHLYWLKIAEKEAEKLHAFDDLECFVSDPETRDEYWREYVKRRERRILLRLQPLA